MDPITVQVDGTDVAVPFDAIKAALPEGTGLFGGDFGAPEGYMPAARFESELDRRVQSKIKNGGFLSPEDAYTADRLRQHFAAKGIDLNEEGLPLAKQDPEQMKRIRQAWEESDLAPVRTELEQAQARLADMSREKARVDVQNAIASELKPDAFKRPADAVPSRFESYFAALAKQDEEGRWYVEESGIANYEVPQAILKVMTKAEPDLAAEKGQRGAGSGGGFGGGDSRTMARADFDAMGPDSQHAFITKGGKVV